MSSIKQRPDIGFTIPNLSELKFTSEAEQEEHELRVAEMVELNNRGYSWTDAYFLAFGYGTIKPYIIYMTLTPDAVSEFTGKPVSSESDYLDVIYTYYEKEVDERQLIEAGTVRRGRKPLDPEVAHAKAVERESRSESYKAYIEACRERKLKLKELWDGYQLALEQKRLAEEHHKKAVNDAYAVYLECKAHTINREDF